MNEPILTELLAALDVIVIEKIRDNAFSVIGEVPAWFSWFYAEGFCIKVNGVGAASCFTGNQTAVLIMTSFDVIKCAYKTEVMIMRTTLALDDDLLEKAQALSGPMDKTALVREALKALIQRESAKRLALLGGSEPMLDYVSRRQSEPV